MMFMLEHNKVPRLGTPGRTSTLLVLVYQALRRLCIAAAFRVLLKTFIARFGSEAHLLT